MEEAREPELHLILDLWFCATPTQVRESLGLARAALERSDFDQTRRDEVELVLAEALNNVVEHAYGGRADGRIHLKIWTDGAAALLRICDFGCEMPQGRPPSGQAACATDRAELPEGGYGWHLIRRLVDGVCYRRCDGKNCLELRLGKLAARGVANWQGSS